MILSMQAHTTHAVLVSIPREKGKQGPPEPPTFEELHPYMGNGQRRNRTPQEPDDSRTVRNGLRQIAGGKPAWL